MKKIETSQAPAAIGPYSQGIISNGFIYTSGQLPIDPATGKIEASTVEEQTVQVIKNVEAEETTKSGIILTSSAKEKPQMAEVLAVGPGGKVDGKDVTMQVEVGQKVIYSKYAGTEVKLDGQEVIIVRQSDILAVVE